MLSTLFGENGRSCCNSRLVVVGDELREALVSRTQHWPVVSVVGLGFHRAEAFATGIAFEVHGFVTYKSSKG